MEVFNPFSLKHKVILLVGASSGIGREISIECSKMGATMIVSSRNEILLNSLVEEMDGDGHKVIVADITKQTDVEHLVSEIPTVDGVLLAPGIGKTMPIQFCKPEDFRRIFDLDFFSYAEITRVLYKNKKIAKNGSIVFMGSVAGGYRMTVGHAMYGTAKAALNNFMKYAALEFSVRGIRVNTICPGMVHTKLIKPGIITEEDMKNDMNEYPLKRYGEVQDIAPAAIFLLSDASSWITGHALVVDGGVSIK